MNEIWKTIPDYEDCYEASNLGRIRSLNRTIKHPHSIKNKIKGKILKQSKFGRRQNKKYFGVNPSINGKNKCCFVHRLVAQAFIPNPENKPCINHKDGDKDNNKVENLEWCTYKENSIHAVKTGLHKAPSGEESHSAKITQKQVDEIRKRYIPRKITQIMLAKEYGVVQETIHRIIKRKIWK